MTRFLDAIVEPALWFAADWSLRWAVLIGVAALGLLLWRPRRAATRHFMCLATLVGGLLLPFAPRWGDGWRLAPEETATPEARISYSTKTLSGGRQPPEFRDSRGADAPRSEPPPKSTEETTTTSSPPTEASGNRRLVVLGLAMCWGLGVLVSLSRRLGGAWFLGRLRRGAVAVQGPALELFAACRAELDVRGRVRLAAHPRVQSPILFGLFRPLILVPLNWSELPAGVQRAALLHELAHVQRCDHWLAPPLEMIRVAFFFHPLVCWLLGRLEHERELLCDEMVVGRGVDRTDYARMLLEFARASGRFALPRLSGTAHLPMSRRRTVKARINHLLEEDMERWMKPLPVRWAVVLGAGLLALMLGLASYRLQAVEPEEPMLVAPKEKEAAKEAPKKPPVQLKREALRYGGKNFDQWRVELQTELKPEIRADGLNALAAFGANGYGPEAARTVVELMRSYDLHTNDKKDVAVVEAAFAAINKIEGPAVPVLWESLDSDSRHIRNFAINCLHRGSSSDERSHVPALLKATKDEDGNTRLIALWILKSVKDKPKSCVPVFLECLKDSENVRSVALENLITMQPEAAEVMSALSKAIMDSNVNVRIAALRMAGTYGAKAKPLVPALLKRLDKVFPDPEFSALLDTLAAIGPGAKDALPKLRKLREESIAGVPNGRGENFGQQIARTIKKIEGE